MHDAPAAQAWLQPPPEHVIWHLEPVAQDWLQPPPEHWRLHSCPVAQAWVQPPCLHVWPGATVYVPAAVGVGAVGITVGMGTVGITVGTTVGIIVGAGAAVGDVFGTAVAVGAGAVGASAVGVGAVGAVSAGAVVAAAVSTVGGAVGEASFVPQRSAGPSATSVARASADFIIVSPSMRGAVTADGRRAPPMDR